MRRRLAVLVAALAAWVAGAALWAPGAAPRAAAAPLFVMQRVPGAEHLPRLDGSGPIFILVLGSDARPGEVVSRARADSIHLVGLNPHLGRATILGFPRDSWVSIPGYGSTKINAAMVYGGPELMVRTVESITGIPIDYYALTSFGGLVGMVNAVGGIEVDVPYAMYDRYSGANFAAGLQHLNGREALALSRNRHDTPSGDFSRSQNQGRLMLAALAQFREEFAEDPSRLLTWVGAGMRNIQTDLSLSEILALAFTVAEIPASSVRNVVVPGGTGSAGGASVVFISSSARYLYADMRGDGVIGRAPPK